MIKEAIKKEMNVRGDTMADLARGINVNYPTIHNFISKGWIRFEVLEKILKYYNLKLIKNKK